MHIGIDLDGTVCTNLFLFVEVLNRHLGRNLRPEDASDIFLEKVYGISDEEFEAIFRRNAEYIFENSVPKDGVARAIRRLIDEGITVSYITARNVRYRDVTLSWLERHGFPPCVLIHEENKLKAAQELGVDLFVEDNPYNARDLAQGGIPVILVDAPYNRTCSGEGIVRMNHWGQFENLISLMYQEAS